jgi:uncharacterized protein (DUF4415 family)
MSLLDKLGLKSIQTMSNDELRQLVASDRLHRAMTRAAGRMTRMKKEEAEPKTTRPRPTLESIGLDPTLISKLRAGGRTDEEIIVALKKRGLL